MIDAVLDKRARTLITPEGVDLRVRLANVSERFFALVIDLLIMVGALVVLTLLVLSALATAQIGRGREVAAIIWLLGFFVLRNFYFTIFECGPRAATIGKRIVGLRVAMRDGRPISADAVVARNAMRELELYLPLSFVFTQGSQVGAWLALLGLIWSGVFVAFPLFNRDALRAGDLIAGTWVLKTPKQRLLPDLASEGGDTYARFAFTDAQLNVYGVKELQALESVLRVSDDHALEAVADRIRAKIGWRRAHTEGDFDFLNAYYRALRQRLERRLLFGVRKRDKHD